MNYFQLLVLIFHSLHSCPEVESLTLYITENWGSDTTQIYYICIKGTALQVLLPCLGSPAHIARLREELLLQIMSCALLQINSRLLENQLLTPLFLEQRSRSSRTSHPALPFLVMAISGPSQNSIKDPRSVWIVFSSIASRDFRLLGQGDTPGHQMATPVPKGKGHRVSVRQNTAVTPDVTQARLDAVSSLPLPPTPTATADPTAVQVRFVGPDKHSMCWSFCKNYF